MKKIIIITTAVIMAALFLYLTKPDFTPGIVENNKEINKTLPNEPISSTQAIKEKIPAVEIDTEVCKDPDQPSLLRVELKQQIRKELEQLSKQGISDQEIYRFASNTLNDNQAAQKYRNRAPHTDYSEDKLKTGEGSKLLQDLMMGSMAGQSKDYIKKFKSGKLNLLDPANERDIGIVTSIFLMGNPEQAEVIINEMFDKEKPLPGLLLSPIVSNVNDIKLVKKLLNRFEDVNQSSPMDYVIFGNSGLTALENALASESYEVAELLLERGAKPNKNNKPLPEYRSSIKPFDYLQYNIDKVPDSLINKLLDNGFPVSSAKSAESMSEKLLKQNPATAIRLQGLANSLNQKEKEFINKLPQKAKDLITLSEQRKKEIEILNIACYQKNQAEQPNIPPYQKIDKEKLTQEIRQLLAANLTRQDIISGLAARNKETVEFAYELLATIAREKRTQNAPQSFADIPPETRKLIVFLKNEDWQGMVDYIAGLQLPKESDISPARMLSTLIRRKAPESAISGMAAIADKNDARLIFNARNRTGMLDRLASYGFNLDAVDQDNKNLFYKSVERNSNKDQLDKLQKVMSYGVSMTSDPYGYDPLDYVLRNFNSRKKALESLNQLNFPINEQHLDYALYIKTYYPERYKELIKAMPNLEIEGKWESKDE